MLYKNIGNFWHPKPTGYQKNFLFFLLFSIHLNVYAQAMYTQFSVKFDKVASPTLNFFTILEHVKHENLLLVFVICLSELGKSYTLRFSSKISLEVLGSIRLS